MRLWGNLISRLRRRTALRLSLAIAVFAFVLVNVFACVHARAMLVFTDGGKRTAAPEELSLGGKARVLVTGVRVPKPRSTRSPQYLGLDFETWRVAVDDQVVLGVWLVPAADPRGAVALFHGYGESKSSMLAEAKGLHDLGWSVVLVDFRGSGDSNQSWTSLGVFEAEDVAAVVARARAEGMPRPFVLYGRSMGAAAVLRAIALHDVAPDAVILEAVFDRVLSAVKNRFDIMGLPAFPMAPLLVFWGGAQKKFNGFSHDPVEYARSVRCPTLVLHGEEDPRTKVAEAKAVFAALASKKRMEVFPGVRHEPCIRVQPEGWAQAVGAFLDALSLASAK